MTVLVTGGAGYIRSHTCVELLDRLYEVVVDNLSNSSEALLKVEEITGRKLTFTRLIYLIKMHSVVFFTGK